ncbi:hypothetical protein NW754_003300 [Fusarium falciforme]|nr:hypothetical protein NW754_003300 [Fusarium falciforme]
MGTYEKSERVNSRPFCRFVHQISLEHERMLETMATPPDFKISPKDPSEDPEEGLKAYYQALGPEIKKKRSQPPPDIDTKAYWRVQHFSWKHERPLEDLIRQAGLEEPSKPESPKGADSPGSMRV